MDFKGQGDCRVSTLEIGREVENRALTWYLEKRPGSLLVARNFHCKLGEIDLILEEHIEGRVELVFVEVRSRKEGSWISGIESVTFPKQRRMRRAIQRFLASYHGKATGVRIDLMSWDGQEFEYLPGIWL